MCFSLAKLVSAEDLIFYESFDNYSSTLDNDGTYSHTHLGPPPFVKGVLNNSVNLSRIGRFCYPIEDNFNLTNGTIEFWVKPPLGNGYGFFDIGYLSWANSWGIFKNANYAIMEVKDNRSSFDQAWSPNALNYDRRWHFIAAKWERRVNTTYFKICLDGECKNDYDGVKANSFPNLTKEFCVGWSGWYGYSESYIDEFKIFSYAKSDDEINDDYLELVNNTLEDIPPKECVMYKPESKGPVKVNCSGLYVNNEKFTAKGVGYQPIPIGKTGTSLVHKKEMYDDVRLRERDFPLLRRMNANTIRTWGEVMNKSWMDDLYNGGVDPIYVLMGFWINCNENWGLANIRENYINNFTVYVNEYKDHPSVLAWGLGNENNLDFCNNDAYLDDFYSLCNELARVAYEIEGENYHPVGIISGDIGVIGIPEYNADDESLNYTDFWGSNVYPGESFGNWFDQYASLSGKPMLVAEYGIDALNNSNRQEYEDVHAEWVLRQWKEINASNVTIGSTLMAYSDEWWKSGNNWGHDYGGYVTNKHPDEYGNEEWWGVMRVRRNLSGGIDIMEPRAVYYALREAFGRHSSFDIGLLDGWNLISFPLNLTNKSISRVFLGINFNSIFSYGSWNYYFNESENNFDVVDESDGYWVNSIGGQTLTVEGSDIGDPSIDANGSWRLLGYKSLNERNVSSLSDNVSVYMYNGSWYSYVANRPWNNLSKFVPGYGYWIKNEE